MACQPLESVEHVILMYKRHLAVDLSEFRLPVGTEVLITETLYYLEVPVEAGDHQQLLEGLRALRQGIELAVMDPRRDDEVARPLWCRLDQHRRLDLYESLPVEIAPRLLRHPVAQHDI